MIAQRRKDRRSAGFTFVEILVTLAILAVMVSFLPGLLDKVVRFYYVTTDRLALQRDARNATEIVITNLRKAVSTTISVDQVDAPVPQPPYSRIRFETVRGSTVTVWQEGHNLYVTDSVSSPVPRVVTPYLRFLAFSYVGSMDDSVMSVNLSLEKESFRRKRIFYVTNDRVRILNE
ncbi:MAG: prepilin-type N-terminal cleavage/methylation domain-containing protein [Elusimicrobia bacterium]|nr:prepilin-type N-terminal cleavage/methylation domain-containing protein [Elusimicrobiota bacterium]